MKLETLKDLYILELKDLYSAEKQIIKALPKMAKAANNKQLAAGFEEHFEQTKEHAARLLTIRRRNPITQQRTSAIAPVKPRLLATSQTVLRI